MSESRAATALYCVICDCHSFLFSQGRSLVVKTTALGNLWEFGYVPRDPTGMCRRNRRLLPVHQTHHPAVQLLLPSFA